MDFSKPELSIPTKIEAPPSDPPGTNTASNSQTSIECSISALPPPKVPQQQTPPSNLSYHVLLVEVSLSNIIIYSSLLTLPGQSHQSKGPPETTYQARLQSTDSQPWARGARLPGNHKCLETTRPKENNAITRHTCGSHGY
jgi:hypothetical protein